MAQILTTSVLSVRVNPDERAVLEAAAEQAHTNLSDFIRRKALAAAEADVVNRTVVTIPARDWEAFESWQSAAGRADSGAGGFDAAAADLGAVRWWR